MIAPSILSADFANLAKDCERALAAGADWLHVDVMDGHFVPNLTIGPCVVQSLRKALPKAILDVHLMVSDPAFWVEPMKKAGASIFTFHIEAVKDEQAAVSLINLIKQNGMKAGVSIKPKTAPEAVKNLVNEIDLLLIMTVEPGFGGQAYMPECAEKCKALKSYRADLLVEVDGGISDKTAVHAAAQGIDVFVAGSYLFNNEMEQRTKLLKQLISK